MLLKGRIAIVTGAAQGIGREYAKVLGANGAAVAVADINLGLARQSADEIVTPGGRAIAWRPMSATGARALLPPPRRGTNLER